MSFVTWVSEPCDSFISVFIARNRYRFAVMHLCSGCGWSFEVGEVVAGSTARGSVWACQQVGIGASAVDPLHHKPPAA